MTFLATVLTLALSAACNPSVAISHDGTDLSSLREEIGRSPALTTVSVVAVKGRLATVKDTSLSGTVTGRWPKADVMRSAWIATYNRNNPRDPLRSLTFVEVLNAAGVHYVTLIPAECQTPA